MNDVVIEETVSYNDGFSDDKVIWLFSVFTFQMASNSFHSVQL